MHLVFGKVRLANYPVAFFRGAVELFFRQRWPWHPEQNWPVYTCDADDVDRKCWRVETCGVDN